MAATPDCDAAPAAFTQASYRKPSLVTWGPNRVTDQEARAPFAAPQPQCIGDAGTLTDDDYDDLFPLDRHDVLAPDPRPELVDDRPAGLRIYTLDEFKALPKPEFVIEGVLVEGVTVLAGQPGSAKSFFAMAAGSAVARGCPLFGRSEYRINRQGPVLFALPEAFRSHAGRLSAFDAYHGYHEPADLFFVRDDINLHNEAAWDRLTDTIDHIEDDLGASLALLIVDTLAAATPGANENAGEEMAAVMARCQSLVSRGTNVLLTHHMNKATGEFRGHTSILGSCDAMLYLTHDRKTGIREMVARKLRDADRIAPVAFQITDTEFGPVPVSVAAKGPWAAFYETCEQCPGLLDAFKDHGLVTPGDDARPCRGGSIVKGLPIRELHSTWNKTSPPIAGNGLALGAVRQRRKRKLLSTVRALVATGILHVSGGSLTGSETDALAAKVTQPSLEGHGHTL